MSVGGELVSRSQTRSRSGCPGKRCSEEKGCGKRDARLSVPVWRCQGEKPAPRTNERAVSKVEIKAVGRHGRSKRRRLLRLSGSCLVRLAVRWFACLNRLLLAPCVYDRRWMDLGSNFILHPFSEARARGRAVRCLHLFPGLWFVWFPARLAKVPERKRRSLYASPSVLVFWSLILLPRWRSQPAVNKPQGPVKGTNRAGSQGRVNSEKHTPIPHNPWGTELARCRKLPPFHVHRLPACFACLPLSSHALIPLA